MIKSSVNVNIYTLVSLQNVGTKATKTCGMLQAVQSRCRCGLWRDCISWASLGLL